MPGHDPEDLTLIIELRDEVSRLLADALKMETETRTETARVHRANAAETARMQGIHNGEMGAMHDALDSQAVRDNKALASREEIGQAVGILVVTMRCTPDEAFVLLVEQSQHEDRKLVEMAAEVVERAVSRAKPRR